MRRMIFFSILLMGKMSYSQSVSEYYQNPIDTTFDSKVLKEKREITVILPRSFSKENASRYPLIIVFDRQNKKIFRSIFESINYLVSFAEMPEAVIIGISTPVNKRYLETTFKPSDENGKGEKLTDFLFQELIPWADAEFYCSHTNIFIGHSRFGYFTSYLLSHKINELTGVISCSPFFLQKNVNLIDSLKNTMDKTLLTHAVYYRFVTGDSLTDSKDYELMKSSLEQSQKSGNLNWKATAFYDAKHLAVPGLGIMPALLEIFDYWSDQMNMVLGEKTLPFSRTQEEQFRQKMKSHYGDKISLGIANLNGIGYKYYNDKHYAEARSAWEILIEDYPEFTESRIKIADTYVHENNPSEAIKNYTLAKQELNTYSFYTLQEKQELIQEIQDKLIQLKK